MNRRQGRGLGADLWLPLPARLCLLTLLSPPLSSAASISPAEPISQAYSLALYMQKNTSALLRTYVSDKGHEQGTRGEGCCLPWPCHGPAMSRASPEDSSMARGDRDACNTLVFTRATLTCATHVTGGWVTLGKSFFLSWSQLSYLQNGMLSVPLLTS